jgi:hypothetical protein
LLIRVMDVELAQSPIVADNEEGIKDVFKKGD